MKFTADQTIELIAKITKAQCVESKTTHPEDVSYQIIMVAEIAGQVLSEVVQYEHEQNLTF